MAPLHLSFLRKLSWYKDKSFPENWKSDKEEDKVPNRYICYLTFFEREKIKRRALPDSNRWPLDLQSTALPLCWYPHLISYLLCPSSTLLNSSYVSLLQGFFPILLFGIGSGLTEISIIWISYILVFVTIFWTSSIGFQFA